jgi:O-antigen ligase
MKFYLFRAASFITILFPLFLVSGVVADVALSLIAALFLLHSYVTKDWHWASEKWFLSLTALCIYMIVRGLLAEFPREAMRHSLPFLRYAIFAAALSHWTLQDALTRKRFFHMLSACVIFVAIDGLLQWVTWRDIFFREIIVDYLAHFRLTGPFKAPILGIMLAWFMFPVCLSWLITEGGIWRRDRFRLLGIVGTLGVIAVIALSGERMALLLALCGWLIALPLLPVSKRLLLLIPVAGVILVGALGLLSPDLFDRQIRSTWQTIAHWQDSRYGKLFVSDMNVAKENIVFGSGSGHVRIYCPKINPPTTSNPEDLCNTHPHNIYMEWLIEEGIIGLIVFSAFVIAIFGRCWKAWPYAKLSPVFIGLLVAFILRVWPFLSSTNFFSRWGAPPFWLILAALLSYTVSASKTVKQTPHHQ